jgi:hypothetical protein
MASRFLNLRQADGGALGGEPINALELDGIEEATQFATAKQDKHYAPQYEGAHTAAQRGGVLTVEDSQYNWRKSTLNAYVKNNPNLQSVSCYITKRLYVPNGAYNLGFILLDVQLAGDGTALVEILASDAVVASISVAETSTVEVAPPAAELPSGTILDVRIRLTVNTGTASAGHLTAKWKARKPIA